MYLSALTESFKHISFHLVAREKMFLTQLKLIPQTSWLNKSSNVQDDIFNMLLVTKKSWQIVIWEQISPYSSNKTIT